MTGVPITGGREHELSALREVVNGTTPAVLVEGEPGLGPTRLLDDAVPRSRRTSGSYRGTA